MPTIKITITMKSPLHIGALSATSTSAMRGLVKDHDGWPYIPASAFKGRLRHTIEKLARGLNYPVCETHRNMCRDARDACPACQIFGSPWIPGTVRFVDFQLSGPEELVREREKKEPSPSTQRYGVSLSRTRKVAEDHLLYTTELFEPGVPLTFTGVLSDVPGLEESAWIIAGVRMLESLGSSRTRGLGWLDGSAEVRDENNQIISLDVLQSHLRLYQENE